MPLYMLDTGISSYIMKRSKEAVLFRLQSVAAKDVCISVVTQAELTYGVAISPRRQHDQEALSAYLRQVQVLDLPCVAALDYADIRAALKAGGKPIAANDFWIAAHARSLNLIFVTNNVHEFSRVEGLRIENWAEPVR